MVKAALASRAGIGKAIAVANHHGAGETVEAALELTEQQEVLPQSKSIRGRAGQICTPKQNNPAASQS